MAQECSGSAKAIEAIELTRRYGDRLAVDHVTFCVARGEIFGFLGPNGAGKSTTVRMLTGYVPPSEGTARVAGYDVARDPVAARQRIGVVPEEANVYADLTVWQNVMLMAELHGVGRQRRMARSRELLEQFGLGDRHRQKGRDLSKGLRQRLMLCAALVSDPEILFLDEPTSGLDVGSAHLIRDIVSRMNRERGMTVFITTHNIEEAGNLCHRIAIINQGRLAVIDTPQNLRGTVESRRSVEVRFEGGNGAAKDVLPSPHDAEIALRAHLAELGLVADQGRDGVAKLIANIMDEKNLNSLPAAMRQALQVVAAQLASLQTQIGELDRCIHAHHRSSEASRRLETIPGIGVIGATAIAATVTDPTAFKSGRELAAWIGLVPRQHSTVGKEKLGGISKQGDRYLRRLLVLGATAAIQHARRHPDRHSWIMKLLSKMPAKLVAVALANKVARIASSLLARGGTYRAPALAIAA